MRVERTGYAESTILLVLEKSVMRLILGNDHRLHPLEVVDEFEIPLGIGEVVIQRAKLLFVGRACTERREV